MRAVHLAGSVERGPGGERFTSRAARPDRRTWLLLDTPAEMADEDDEILERGRDRDRQGRHPVRAVRARCTGGRGHEACGRGHGGGAVRMSAAGLRPVRRLATASGTPTGCLACGARGAGMVRLFESGNEAAAAVLATALYQALPPDEELADRPGGGRKLLTFSDSRQAAAFFAPYLESSHALVRQRRLILDGLARATARDAEATVDDLIEETAAAAGRAGVFSRRESRQGRRREAARWVMRELVALDERQSLEGLGLLRVGLGADPSWQAPRPLLDLGLSAQECVLLLTELLRTVRLQGALTMPEEVDPADEMFDPRRGPIYVRGDGAEARLRVLSWLPTRGVNKRLDYLRRLLAAVGEPGSGMDARDVLAGCWRALCAAPEGWLHATALPRLGQVHQVDHTWLTLWRGGSDLWQCTLCRRVTATALRGVCPTLGCAGELVAGRADDDGHYRALYRQTAPVPLVAREHTAQWTGLEAADIQQRFLAGEVNVLSCSTTFELGVDVGALSAVLLRNMPPTTANYIQRAGRAGRRSGTAALVVTYAQRRSHDLSRYAEPESMLDRAGPRPLRAAGKSPHRPAARAFGGARRLLPRRQGQRGPGVEDRRGFLPARRRRRAAVQRGPRLPHPGARRGRRRPCVPCSPSPHGRRSAWPTGPGWTSCAGCWTRSAPSSSTTWRRSRSAARRPSQPGAATWRPGSSAASPPSPGGR